MESNDTAPAPSKGYQKKIKPDTQPAQKPKREPNAQADGLEYSSPTAKKWPLLIEALESGNTAVVQQLIEEGINLNVKRDGVTPLMLAASKGRAEIAEVILQAGVNINEISDDGWTALHKAAYDQTGTGIVDLLMQSGIDVDAKNASNKTALQLAEERKHGDIVRLIQKHQLQKKIDAKDWEDFLRTPEGKPFEQSRRYDDLALTFKLWWIPLLVLSGAGVLLGFFFGVVKIAAGIGVLSGLLAGAAILLLEWRIKSYLDRIGPLPYLDIHIVRAKRKAGERIVLDALAAPAPPGANHGPPNLELAPEFIAAAPPATQTTNSSALISERRGSRASLFATQGNPAVVTSLIIALVFIIFGSLLLLNKDSLEKWYYAKKLTKNGFPFTEQAFLVEISKNNEEAVELFLRAGINSDALNEKGQTACTIASEKGYANIVRKLVARNAAALNAADKSGNTALMSASREGQEDIVQLLLEQGAIVNVLVPDREGAATALQAVLDTVDFKERHMRIVLELLQHGADVDGKNSAGRTPLLFAANHGRTEAAKVLIKHGALVNETDREGFFPLMAAACGGHSRLVALLAEKGADMTMALPDGRTPLMCAAQGDHGDAVKTLLERGANVNAKAASGASALTEATRTGNVDIVKVLLAGGADPAGGCLPDSFTNLQGKTLALNAKKLKISDILGRIAKTAALDGYRVASAPREERIPAFIAKGPWNIVLQEFAVKNHQLLIVKEKDVFIVPYDLRGSPAGPR